MNRSQLEHIIRAAAGNTDATDIVVVGSQAILGTFPEAPAELLISIEADVFPRDRPHDSILIDGAIGERSLFCAIRRIVIAAKPDLRMRLTKFTSIWT